MENGEKKILLPAYRGSPAICMYRSRANRLFAAATLASLPMAVEVLPPGCGVTWDGWPGDGVGVPGVTGAG